MRSLRRIGGTSLQRLVAGTVALTAVTLAITGAFVFRRTGATPDPSVWQLVLSDHVTLGFVRLAAVALCLYAITSIAALVSGGRWMKGFGPRGFETDEPKALDERLERLKAQLREAEERRDRAVRLLEEYLHG